MSVDGSPKQWDQFRGVAWSMSLFLFLDVTALVAVGYLCQSTEDNLQTLYVQGALLFLSCLVFVVITWGKLRRLKAQHLAQRVEVRDLKRILDTLDEGVFTLDPGLSFGPHHSRSLGRLLGRPILAGADFQTLFGDLAGGEELELAVMYLRLLSAGRVKENLIRDANPMREIPVKTEQGTRYLKFVFRRLDVNEQAFSLLGMVIDVTEQVGLRTELTTTRREAGEQWNAMLQLVQMQPQTLTTFINEATAGLLEINDRLKGVSGGISDFRTMISQMFRQAHSIKGNANTIGLTFVSKEAHALENLMDGIRGRDTYTPEELAELEQTLLQMFDHLGWLRKTVAHCSSPSTPSSSASAEDEPVAAAAPVAPYIEFQNNVLDLMQRIAESHAKQVQGDVRLAALQKMPEDKSGALRTIVSQLVRNAVVHGIEAPAERSGSGKSEKGRVLVELVNTVTGGPAYVLRVRDDGWGLSAERIRQALLTRGEKTADEVAALTDQQVVMEVFRSGFSTAVKVDEHAGRGVGLDLVRETVRAIGGRVNLKTKAGLFTEISVAFTV